MSITIYYPPGKADDDLKEIERINFSTESDMEFVPVDDEFGLHTSEYLIQLDDEKILLSESDPIEVRNRCNLYGWSTFILSLEGEQPTPMEAVCYAALLEGLQ